MIKRLFTSVKPFLSNVVVLTLSTRSGRYALHCTVLPCVHQRASQFLSSNINPITRHCHSLPALKLLFISFSILLYNSVFSIVWSMFVFHTFESPVPSLNIKCNYLMYYISFSSIHIPPAPPYFVKCVLFRYIEKCVLELSDSFFQYCLNWMSLLCPSCQVNSELLLSV